MTQSKTTLASGSIAFRFSTSFPASGSPSTTTTCVTGCLPSEVIGSQCADNLEKIKTYKNHQEKLEKQIEDTVLHTIQKVQGEFGVDIFGFGSTFERQNYPTYKKVKKDWDELFSKAEIDVNVDMSLRRSGIRNRSFLTDLKDKETK